MFVVQVRDHESDGTEFVLYGPFRSVELAHEFAGAVVDAIEKWQLDHADQHGPQETSAWAYVVPLNRSRDVEKAMRRGFGVHR